MTKRINSPDTEADVRLRECLDQNPRRSFIMIAGAGSGKTTSLVKALSHILSTQGSSLKRRGQKVACITYTEIAANEIWNDVENNPLTHISTIHRFFWTVIKPFQADIKKWVVSKIEHEIQKLKDEAIGFGPKVYQKTRDKNTQKIDKYELLKTLIPDVPKFDYELGSDYANGILGHGDVIEIVTTLIHQKPLLRNIIGQKFPYIFIDESQDTFPSIVEAMKNVDRDNKDTFCLGFFGDPMQKIYPQGAGLITPETGWEEITKEENFRCSQRVLELINNIRRDDDGLEQTRGRTEIIEGKTVTIEGSAQIFILPADGNRTTNLQKIQHWCAGNFDDNEWIDDKKIKILVIVHRMAANRLGFPNLYASMNDKSSPFSDRFADGTAWPLKPFLSLVLPIVENIRSGNNFATLSLLREHSPQLASEKVKGTKLADILNGLKTAVEQLRALMDDHSTATVHDVLNVVLKNKLMVLDERLLSYISVPETADAEDDEYASVKAYLSCPAVEFWGYKKYYDDESPFATQQGVKGAQFDRVMTILDDEEGAGHRQFSYGKYFGVTELSKSDNENIAAKIDNAISRTRRLFYVSCSRARKDLVVVYYTAEVDKTVKAIKAMNLFREKDVFTLDELQSI